MTLGSTVSVLLGKGDGTFQTPTYYAVGNGRGPESVTVGDFNGDGKSDLAVANEGSDTVSILLANGDGTFQTKTDYTVGYSPYSITVGDFDGDGKTDLAVANCGGNTVSILLGKGDGTFQTKTDYTVGSGPEGITVGDFNGDGKTDLATANEGNNTVSILLATPVQHQASVGMTSSASPSTYGQLLPLTATVSAVAQANGTPTGTVTFYDGTTPLSGPVALANGIAGLTTSALGAGIHTITAVYSGDANFNGSTGAMFQPVNQTAPAFGGLVHPTIFYECRPRHFQARSRSCLMERRLRLPWMALHTRQR